MKNTFQKNLENRKYAKEEKVKKTKKVKKAKKVKLLNKNKQSLKSLDKKNTILGSDEKPEIKKLKNKQLKKEFIT